MDNDWVTCKAAGVRSSLGELSEGVDITLESDSNVAIASQFRLDLEKTKHVQIKFQFPLQMVEEWLLATRKAPSPENTADIGTKHMDEETFEKHQRACHFGDPDAVLPTVKEETITKRNSGFTWIMDGVRTCLAGNVLALQLGSVCGEASGEYEEAPLGSILLALLLGALLALLGYLVAVWRQKRPTTVSRGMMCELRVMAEEELGKLTVEALREELRQYGAKVGGDKGECVERLAQYRRRERTVPPVIRW